MCGPDALRQRHVHAGTVLSPEATGTPFSMSLLVLNDSCDVVNASAPDISDMKYELNFVLSGSVQVSTLNGDILQAEAGDALFGTPSTLWV